jgi:phosphopantothenoylcysteine decarboxylase/phosphopantothenate--cysteine ligase
MKRGESGTAIELVPNADLLAEIGAARTDGRPYLVGFALETVAEGALVAAARQKLAKKRVDLVVANRASDAFDHDDNVAVLVTATEAEALGRLDKRALADRSLDRVQRALGSLR